MPKIEIYNVGSIGVNRDLPPHYLPPEAWTDSNNMRFQDRTASKIKGHEQIFGTPTVAPGFLLNVPKADTSFWIYCSLTKAYVYESGVHTNITRQTASVDVNYTAIAFNQWNGGALGGVPLLNNGIDVPQYWPSLLASTKLADLTNWPAMMRAKILRPFGPFLVALNINDNGTLYPHMFWWSHPADPGLIPASWDYADPAYDTGRKELTDVEGGQILDALILKNLLIIYKETSTHYMRFVGGQEIMANDLLWASSGILASRCVTLIDQGKKHFVATADDIVQHNGQEIESVLDAKARKYLKFDLDSTNFRNSFCCHNQAQREAWFVYPSSGAEFPNKVLIWNYQYNTIQFRDFVGNFAAPGVAVSSGAIAWNSLTDPWNSLIDRWSEEGNRQLLIADAANTKIFQADKTELFDSNAITSFVERIGLAVIGRDRQGQPKADYTQRKLAKRIWPKITGTAPVTIRVGAQEDFDDAVVWSDAQIFTPGIDKYLDMEANGRLLAVRFESNSSSSWQLEGYDLDIELLGEH